MTTQPSDTEKQSRYAVMVLGMHRSGTSALTGLLTRLGGDGPATPLSVSVSNQLGHFEPEALYQLQDALLASAGTNWNDYTRFPDSWLTSHKATEYADRVKDLLKTEFGSSRFFVVKDPRNCRLVPFWRNLLAQEDIQPLFVHTHRNPIEVAQSLQKRDGFDLEYGYLLWLRHILDAEIGTRGQTRSFTSYDRLLEQWPSEVEKIARDLGITWPRYSGPQLANLSEMIRPDLKRNVSNGLIHSTVFAAWFRDTFDVFNRWARDGENAEDHMILDQIRFEFDKSSDAFSGAVHAKGKAHAQKLEKLAADHAKTQKEAKDAQVAHEALKTKYETMQKEIQDAQATLGTLKTEYDASQTALETVNAKHDLLKDELDLSRSTLNQRTAELDDTHQALQELKDSLSEEQSKTVKVADELSEARAQIQTLQGEAQRHAEAMTHAQKAMLKYQTENEAAHQTSLKLQRSVKDLNKKVTALRNSTSWRITAPIRWCVRLIKR